MFESKNHFRNFAWGCLILTFVLLNTKGFWTGFPSFQEKAVQGSLENSQEYKDVLDLQKAFVRNAKKIKPSVVSINKVKELVEKSSWYDPHNHGSEPWYSTVRNWFVQNLRSRKYAIENVGSGIVLDSNGYILTNYHVIENLDRVLVKLSDGKEYFAKVLGYDTYTDLAALKISTLRRLREPEFGQATDLSVGEWVMAIGNPYGLDGTVTVGVVSGTGRTDLGITHFENFIQTDASINPGNSGGPLINLDGQIVGINTAVAAIGSGVSFAIPVEMALKVVDQLIHKGSVDRGWLGIGIQDLTPELAYNFSLVSPEGVLVNSIENKTPAQMGGMLRGDIIIQFDGKTVSGLKYFQKLVADTVIGKRVPVKILRDGQEKILQIKIGKMRS
ncbi:MAG: trypsin-like serine protease [Nitrospina sp.]|jgi:S1-C subfamily serine protease|nr:trypsin-like serine protease [Nitrospina sp.]MBT3414974.1 trypsin-like serine protease [Nitrospina sp.]MBT3856631.1 trypsin-like serine protease [Nitrospina sp.]MBT4103556.1 trypsin-like serine protease [Nitrospina sp.]MBT4388737.1 trypsin-like serine protease [Nitrospina sp.]